MSLPPALHELESRVMSAVWDQGEATVRSVTDAVAVDGPRSYTTILTVMTRLDRKGFLDRRREGIRIRDVSGGEPNLSSAFSV